MRDTLRNHPFAVEAFFKNSTVLTFAIPKVQLQSKIPECLSLDTFEDHWAFIAVAMVQTSALRPKGFPAFLGNNFFLIGYRIFVRYKNLAGKNLRGLHILKSETDNISMEILGNIFTKYSYTTTDITIKNTNSQTTISSLKSGIQLEINRTIKDAPLPENSPFNNWKEARKYAGPLPFTFSFDDVKKEVLIIQGVRQNWVPKAICIQSYNFDFLKKLNLQNAVLANAFEITNVPYWWKKGKIEKWQP